MCPTARSYHIVRKKGRNVGIVILWSFYSKYNIQTTTPDTSYRFSLNTKIYVRVHAHLNSPKHTKNLAYASVPQNGDLLILNLRLSIVKQLVDNEQLIDWSETQYPSTRCNTTFLILQIKRLLNLIFFHLFSGTG